MASDRPLTKLPDLPSVLIRLALADLIKAEVDPRYVIDMSEWHRLENDGCHICLAGAVLAGTLEIPSHKNVNPDVMEGIVRQKLLALDEFRSGDVDYGLARMGCTTAFPPGNRYIPEYDRNPQDFKNRLAVLASELEEAGL